MKKLIFITLIVISNLSFAQEPFVLTYGNTQFGFEDTSEFKYILFDTAGIWQIDEPDKNVLFMDSKVLYTDTNLYYRNNLNDFFQFRIFLGEADAYTIRFNHKYDFEKNRDGGIIETSHDDGITWQNILIDTLLHPAILGSPENFYNFNDTISSFNLQPGFTGLQSELTTSSYMFTSDYSIKEDTMIVRFTISSDSNNSSNEGWGLDNFIFIGHMMTNTYEINNHSYLNIYPNPAYSSLNIESDKGINNLKIVSTTGTIMSFKTCENPCQLDVSNLQAGLYFIICENMEKNIFISKFVKL